jgi:dienelactone hydrolase
MSRRQHHLPAGRAGGSGRVRDVLLMSGAVVIAVHVVDDSFLQPQPGTSARDHLASGFVPLALLALAAVLYPRLGGCGRAAVALTLGAFGIVAGVEAAYYTMHSGPSGDDYAGLVSIPAGLMLVTIGVVVLWTTRRRDGGRGRRLARRSVIGVASIVVAFYIALPIGISYVSTHVGRLSATHVDLGPSVDEVAFTTRDGITIAGSYIPSRNGAAIIAFPGRSGPQEHARMLARHGYGVLLFDLRGDGESQGDPNGFGWDSDKDVMAAIGYLKRRPDVDPRRIGGLGLSVGGELLLQAAAQNRYLRAVVSEGAGSRSIGEELERPGAAKWLVSFPVAAMISAGTTVFSNSPPPPHLKDIVGRIAPRSVFLIYTTHGVDTEDLNPQYYAAAGQPKLIWKIPEAGHTGGLTARPDEYERRVIAFFDRALARKRA